jgi:carbon-monoxide dehydrogenase medium subunit
VSVVEAAALHRPESLERACQLLAELDQPMVYGGGTAIQILLKQGVLFATDLVDLALVPGLDRIERTAEGLRVGPLVTLRRMETDPLVRQVAPLAADVYGRVANPRVRNTASVGGNLAHGDYRLDPPTALLTLDARIELISAASSRQIPVREFFVGFQETALAHGELVSSILIPAQPSQSGAEFVKLSSLSANDWPCASAAALVVPAGRRGRDREVRLGLGALAARPEYLSLTLPADTTLEQAMAAAAEAADAVIDPIADVRGGVDFKRRLGLVAVRDAVGSAWTKADEPVDTDPARHEEEDSNARRASRRRWWRGR